VFLHDRGTYKQGWQLDADWNAAQEAKRKRILLGLPEEDEKKGDDEEKGLPWACPICRQGFTNPIVTNCGHYFCEKCALDAYVKDTKCPACRAQTHGAFNTATKLISVLKQRAASGIDPRAEIERLEKQRLAEKVAQATGHNWIMPGRTPDLAGKKSE
jgi:RING finger protein 113A